MILSLLIVSGALVFLCWLIFTLATFALPCFVGVSAAMLAHGSGAGILSAAVLGLVAGVLTLVAGQAALASVRAPILRWLILAIFVGPAGIAGFGVVRDVAMLTGAGIAWATLLAVFGAVATMAAAIARLVNSPLGAECRDGGAEPLTAQRPRCTAISPIDARTAAYRIACCAEQLSSSERCSRTLPECPASGAASSSPLGLGAGPTC